MEGTSKRNLMMKIIYSSLLHRWHGVMKKVHVWKDRDMCSGPGSATKSSWYAGHSFIPQILTVSHYRPAATTTAKTSNSCSAFPTGCCKNGVK